MITLTIGNSYSRIQGLSIEQERSLRDSFSYVVGGSSAYYSRFGAKQTSLLTKRCEFPTGLLGRLPGYPLTIVDKRIKPAYEMSNMILAVKSDVRPHEWQDAAVMAAYNVSRGILTAPTGTGKSYVIALLAAKLNLKTLVVVPSIEIKKQLQASLAGLNKVVVEHIASRNLKNMADFDCLIIDEAHHVASKTYRRLNKTAWKGIYYRYFLSATPFRNDTEETLLFEAIAGQVIYQYTYAEAVADKCIVPIEAYYIEIPKQNTEAYTYQETYNQLVVNNETRNQHIVAMLVGLQASNKSTLCLVREVKHGKILAELTGLPFVYGEDEDSRKYIEMFSKGEIPGLIGTEKILGEGVDTKACEYVVIAGLGKAKSSFMQKCGRAVRRFINKESAKVIIFQDKSHKYLKRHFKVQKNVLKEEYGLEPIKLEVL